MTGTEKEDTRQGAHFRPMSRAHQQGGEPSHRMLRVAELIRHTVSDSLSRAVIHDPALDGVVVTVPNVRMSPDLKLATVFVMPLGGKDVDGIVKALERNKKVLRTEIAHKVNLKFAPDIRFKADDSFDTGAKIDALFERPDVKRDLAQGDLAQDDLAQDDLAKGNLAKGNLNPKEGQSE